MVIPAFNELYDVVVQNLHHIVLIDFPILNEQACWQSLDIKCFFEFLLLWCIDVGKAHRSLELIGDDAHYIDDVLAHKEVILGALLFNHHDKPGDFRWLRS